MQSVARIQVRPPTLADLDAMHAGIRIDDLRELEAGSGPDVRLNLGRTLRRSPHRWAMDVDGKLGLLGGVTALSLLGGVGSPWLIGTRELDRIPGALTRVALKYRDLALGLYPELVNYIDMRNRKSIRWLKRLGFTVHPDPIPYGPYKMPFLKFEIRSHV
jgi:hypothetical protein